MRLEEGMLITTNYSGPYRIKSIERDCTCNSYLDELEANDPDSLPPDRPHIHLVCTKPDGSGGEYYLHRYDEGTLLSLDTSYCNKTELDYDWIEILENDQPVQNSMF